MKAGWILAIRLTLFLIAIAIFIIGLCMTLTPIATKVVSYDLVKKSNQQFQYEKVSGVVYGPITYDHVTYNTAKARISIDQMTLQTNLRGLLNKKLELSYLKADHISIHLNNSTAPTSTVSKETIAALLNQLKYQLHITQLTLNNVDIYANDQLIAKIKTLNGEAFLSKDKIALLLKANILTPKLATVTVNIAGSPQQYQTHLAIHYQNNLIQAEGAGDLSHFQLSFAPGALIQGNLQWQWSPQLLWQTTLKIQQLALPWLNPKNPPLLSATIQGQGNTSTGQLELTALQVPIAQHSITGSSNWQYQNGKQQFALKLQSDQASLIINGQKDPKFSIHWQMNVPQLSDFFANASGQIVSQGQFHWDQWPVSEGNLTIHALTTPFLNMDQLNSHWQIAFNNKTMSALNLSINNAFYHNTQIKQAQLNFQGSLLKQKMTVTADTNWGTLNTEIIGGPSLNHDWVGNFYRLNWDSPEYGTWSLDSKNPTPVIQFNQTKFDLPALCSVANDQRSTCLSAHWEKNKNWLLKAEGKNHLINPIMQSFYPSLKIQGLFDFSAELQGQGKDITSGTALVKTKNNGQVKMDIDQKESQLIANLIIDKNNFLETTLRLPNYHQLQIPPTTQPVEGKLKINMQNLDNLSAFIPETLKTAGKLSAEMAMHGTIGKPQITGKVQLDKATVTIPALNITVHGAELLLTGTGNQLIFNGQFFSDKEPIIFKGVTDLDRPSFPTAIDVSGHNVLVMDTPEYQIHATADLKLDIKNKVLWVRGDVYLPKASIKPDNNFDTISLPDDVVVINSDSDEALQEKHWHLGLAGNITAGDEVIYEANGIQAGVTGTLEIFKKPGSAILGNGQLNLEKGVYEAHGTTLKIAQGALNFHNSPINNPGLNIKAVRQMSPNGLTVGIQIQGILHNPKTHLFSTPTQLSDIDILSYILFGQPVNPLDNNTDISTSKNQNRDSAANLALILQAANALTPSGDKEGSSSILSGIQTALDFQEFGVENTANVDPWKINLNNQSSFVAGRYLTPNLYLRYAKDLGTDEGAANSLLLRYQLSKHLAVQANAAESANNAGNVDSSNQSSFSSGLDLIYSFERK